MDEEKIIFLRALCSKVKEIATLCDAYLEQEAKKSKKTVPSTASEAKAIVNRLIPVAQWSKFHTWPSASSLRWMIFCSHKTGADFFVRKVGRRNLICEKSFFEWANMSEEQRIKASPEATRFRATFGKR